MNFKHDPCVIMLWISPFLQRRLRHDFVLIWTELVKKGGGLVHSALKIFPLFHQHLGFVFYGNGGQFQVYQITAIFFPFFLCPLAIWSKCSYQLQFWQHLKQQPDLGSERGHFSKFCRAQVIPLLLTAVTELLLGKGEQCGWLWFYSTGEWREDSKTGRQKGCKAKKKRGQGRDRQEEIGKG